MSKAKRSNRSKGGNLAQYGLFDIPTDLNFDDTGGSMDDEHDSDLEAELAALTDGGGAKPKRPVKKPIPDSELDAMVAESLKDIPSDAELSGDDDDPELLNELNEITGGDYNEPESESQPEAIQADPTNDVANLLSERLKMYEEAEKKAKEAGESSRARRFNRGIKTIKDLIKQVNAGKTINNDDIPPIVSTSVRKPTNETETADQPKPTRPAPSIPTPTEPEPEAAPEPEPVPEPQEESPESTEPKEEESVADTTPQVDNELINMLTERKNQYKMAALKAKKSGDSTTAINYIKIAKQFDIVIKAAENGQPVDLSRMPDPPLDPQQQQQHEKIEENKIQQHDDSIPQITIPEGEIPEETLIMASSIEEALQQRLEVYKKQEESAKEQGNASKARRMGRIVKQFEQAIKLHKAGKPIPVDELPTPPGYGPIPVPGAATTTTNKPETSINISPEKPKPPQQPSTSQSTRITGNQMPNSRAEKQLVLLLAKQKEFKEAALKAKRKGEIEQAKEYLRTAKGFDPLIEAATCGLPVDLSTLPISPNAKIQLDNEYDVVMADECTDKNDTNLDVLSRLEAQLTKQLKMCLSTRDHHKALGDVAGTNRFERLALNVTKDLDLIRLAHRTPGAGVPKFHYEIKDFAIVKSFTELGDNELELAILRGISYTCTNPKEIDTYVKFEFPYPQDEPFKDRTPTVKDTNSPEYNQTFIIPIQRTARACQRIFKRQSVKFEVYSKGGWFRGDTLIGTVNVKLQPLETQCELHDSFDLLEGRKKVGGKLEIRIRLRHPIVSQQIEQLQEKWLVIDN